MRHIDVKTRSRLFRGSTIAAAGFSAAGVFAPSAAADVAPPSIDGLAGLQTQDLLEGAPSAPDPLPALTQVAANLQGAVPSNLLRTNSASSGDAFEQPSVDNAAAEYDSFAAREAAGAVPPIQQINANFVNSRNGTLDDNTIGQWFGAAQAPSLDTVNAVIDDAQQIASDIQSGKALDDLSQAISDTLNSEAFDAWRNNDASILDADSSLSGVDRAASGISLLIDSATVDPVGTVADLVEAAGGMRSVVSDPLGAAVRAATQVLGPDLMRSFYDFIDDAGRNVVSSLRDAAPALIAIPALSAISALLLTPLGVINGASIGALIGALSPHNLLAAIPGAILGGLATGIPGALAGLIGSTLVFLPLMAALPLMGAAGGSALALAIAATITYGTWLLSFIPAALLSGLAGIGTALLVGIGLLALSGLNPVMIPAAIGGGILAGLFVFTMTIGGYALLTFLIPTIAFALIAPLLTLGLGGLGALLGLGAGTLAAAIGIPLITALMAAVSALPGAILGGLLGIGLSSLISALIGAVIGGIAGGVIAALIGSVLGAALGALIGIPLFIALALSNFGDWLSDRMSDPDSFINQIARAARQGWDESLLSKVFDELFRNVNQTDTARAFNDLIARINALAAVTTFLDGRRLREMLLRGSLLGAIIGGLAGAAVGGPIGALAGLLNPLNLLNGLLGGITGALVGAPLGAALGKGLSLLLGTLTTLVATPLLFLPILVALTGLWAALAIPATLVALASTLIGPLAIAVGATIIGGLLLSSPLWVPLTVVSTVLTLVAFALSNSALIAAFPPLAAALPFAFAIGAVGAGLAVLNVLVILGSLALAAAFIGIPAFLLSLPFFIFPALAVPLLSLLALPLLIPVAAGLSLLTGMSLGALVDNLSSLITVPLGALLGALTLGVISGVASTIIAALVRAAVYGLAGALIGAGLGAAVGSVLGAVAALVTHLRASAGVTGDGIVWADGRIVNQGGFGDILSGVPGLSGEKRVAVPKVAAPRTSLSGGVSRDKSLRDVSSLVAA